MLDATTRDDGDEIDALLVVLRRRLAGQSYGEKLVALGVAVTDYLRTKDALARAHADRSAFMECAELRQSAQATERRLRDIVGMP